MPTRTEIDNKDANKDTRQQSTTRTKNNGKTQQGFPNKIQEDEDPITVPKGCQQG